MTLVMSNPLEKSTNLLFHGHLTSERSQDNWVPTHNNSQFLKEFQHISWHCKNVENHWALGKMSVFPHPYFKFHWTYLLREIANSFVSKTHLV